MKKSKIASDLPRTSPAAMAPKNPDMQMEPSEEDKLRSGEYDLDHLMKAEDIKNDPEKMEYVHKAHAKKTVSMRSIADLKVAGQALAAQTQEAAKAKASQPREKTRYPKREK
jgi:hypothetical protein